MYKYFEGNYWKVFEGVEGESELVRMSGNAEQNGLIHNNENSSAVGQCCSCQGSSAIMSPPADWRR